MLIGKANLTGSGWYPYTIPQTFAKLNEIVQSVLRSSLGTCKLPIQCLINRYIYIQISAQLVPPTFIRKFQLQHLNLNQDIPCELLAQLTQIKNPNIAKNDYQGWALRYDLGLDTRYTVSLSQITMIITWYSYFPQ